MCKDCPSQKRPAVKYIIELSHRRTKSYIKQSSLCGIVTPSSWLRKKSLSSATLGSLPTYLINNPIDTNLYKPLKPETWQLTRHSLTTAENIVVLILGSGKIAKDSIRDKIRVVNLGYIDDYSYHSMIYAISDLILFPSITENFSNILLEAMSCGTPSLVFNVGGNPEIVSHRVNGFICQEVSANAFSEALSFLLSTKEYLSYRSSAREAAVEKYDPGLIGSRYRSFFSSLTGAR